MWANKMRAQRGANMVESALTLTAFMLLVFGIVGFGFVMWGYTWTSHAAREATRWAAVRGKDSGLTIAASDVTTYVTSNNLGLNAANIAVSTVWDDANHTPGTYVQVTVSYQIPQYVPFVSAMTVSSTSKTVIDQ